MIRSILVMIAVASLSGPVLAHKVNVFAYVEDEQLYIEGYFNDGKMARNSSVEVRDGDGEVVISDVTDDQGQLTLDLPQQSSPLRIVLNAGMGHQGEYVMSAGDLGGAAPSAAVVTPPPAPTPGPAVDQAQLEATVQHAVNEAVKPLVKALEAAQERASLSDIIGGVGLIVGILGAFAFYKARQRVPSSVDGADSNKVN